MTPPTTSPASSISGRLLVATLRGSARERGRRHGELFGTLVRESGIIDFYHDYCARALPIGGAWGRLAVQGLHALCARRHSETAQELISGFCSASGISRGRFARGAVMPDVVNYLVGFAARLRSSPALGCTSAAAWGDATPDGALVYGRNLDFPGIGFYDRHPLVCRNFPDRGIPYVSVATAGAVVDGITGINAEGVSVALHQHLSKETAIIANGRPVVDLGMQILQNARTIDAAVELCASWKTTSAWTVVLTHAKTRRAAMVERTPAACSVVPAGPVSMARTNDYVTPERRRHEVDYRSWRESSRLRLQRAERIIEENRGRVDAPVMARLLGDHTDAESGTLRGFTTIAQMHNMTSVVFEPEKGILWIGEGEAPANRGPYRRVALWEDSPPGETLPGVSDSLPAPRRDAQRSYARAYLDYMDGRPGLEILESLAEAVDLDPAEPVYRYMMGLFALRTGNPETAMESFAAGAAMPDITYRQAAQRLWRARALDLLGRRSQALALYEDLLRERGISRALWSAASKGVAHPFTRAGLPPCLPDLLYGDVMGY